MTSSSRLPSRARRADVAEAGAEFLGPPGHPDLGGQDERLGGRSEAPGQRLLDLLAEPPDRPADHPGHQPQQRAEDARSAIKVCQRGGDQHDGDDADRRQHVADCQDRGDQAPLDHRDHRVVHVAHEFGEAAASDLPGRQREIAAQQGLLEPGAGAVAEAVEHGIPQDGEAGSHDEETGDTGDHQTDRSVVGGHPPDDRER